MFQSIPASITKIPQPSWLVDNKHLFFTVLEAESPKSRLQQTLVKTLFLVHRQLSPCSNLTWQKGQGSLLHHKSHSRGLCPCDLITSQRSPSHNTIITLRIRFQHVNLGGWHKHSFFSRIQKYRFILNICLHINIPMAL